MHTLRTIAQLRTNKLSFFKYNLHKIDRHKHSSPLCLFTKQMLHITQHLFNCKHIRIVLSALDLWTDPMAVADLLAQWSDRMVTEQCHGMIGPPLYYRRWWVDNNNNNNNSNNNNNNNNNNSNNNNNNNNNNNSNNNNNNNGSVD